MALRSKLEAYSRRRACCRILSTAKDLSLDQLILPWCTRLGTQVGLASGDDLMSLRSKLEAYSRRRACCRILSTAKDLSLDQLILPWCTRLGTQVGLASGDDLMSLRSKLEAHSRRRACCRNPEHSEGPFPRSTYSALVHAARHASRPRLRR